MGAVGRFFRVLVKSRAGFIGFIGLVFFALLVFVGPLFVPFDGEVKLDQINAPPGARLQLLTRTEDTGTYTTLESLEGRTVGVIRSSSGELLVEPFEDDEFFEVEDYSRRQIDDALEELSEGDTDALLLFSTLVNEFILRPAEPEFANLAVSNPRIGPIHLLGADTQGRDILSHIVNGGRTLIITAFLAGFISTAIAVLFGTLAALLGGVVDRVLTAIANFILVIPRFPLLVVLAALFTLNSVVLLAALIGLLAWPALMRAVRAQVSESARARLRRGGLGSRPRSRAYHHSRNSAKHDELRGDQPDFRCDSRHVRPGGPHLPGDGPDQRLFLGGHALFRTYPWRSL